MGYYLSADVSLKFVSPEALMRAALMLAPERVIESESEAVGLVWAAWEECGEMAEFVEYLDEPLTLSGYSSGRWYSGAYGQFVAAMAGNAVGVIDFAEEQYAMWRERFHRDGTVTKHEAVVTYEGDVEEE